MGSLLKGETLDREAPHTSIRTAQRKDWSAILALIRRYPEQIMQTHLPRRNEFFVAMDGGTLAGCCALEIYSKRLAEIRSLAVDVHYQGNGIAKALILECLAKAKRKKIHQVITTTDAVELFEGTGFKLVKQGKHVLIKVIDDPAVS